MESAIEDSLRKPEDIIFLVTHVIVGHTEACWSLTSQFAWRIAPIRDLYSRIQYIWSPSIYVAAVSQLHNTLMANYIRPHIN